jgi:hypothetical protein
MDKYESRIDKFMADIEQRIDKDATMLEAFLSPAVYQTQENGRSSELLDSLFKLSALSALCAQAQPRMQRQVLHGSPATTGPPVEVADRENPRRGFRERALEATCAADAQQSQVFEQPARFCGVCKTDDGLPQRLLPQCAARGNLLWLLCQNAQALYSQIVLIIPEVIDDKGHLLTVETLQRLMEEDKSFLVAILDTYVFPLFSLLLDAHAIQLLFTQSVTRNFGLGAG